MIMIKKINDNNYYKICNNDNNNNKINNHDNYN